jgi:anti-sigma factor RsiW
VAEVVEGHIRALQGTHLLDVASSDQHTVKPWFDGRLDFAPPVRDLAASGFPLLGGRLERLRGRPAAALVYGRARHVINLFVQPAPGSAAPEATTREGYNVMAWREDGMAFDTVSDVAAPDLARFVAAFRAAR